MSQKCRQGYPLSLRSNSLISMRPPTINDDGNLEYIFPNPFQFLGFALPAQNIPAAPPQYTDGWDFDITSEQNLNYAALLYPMFISFMYANRESDNGETAPFPGVTYTEIPAFGKFAGYFMNYLNDSLKPTNFNTFLEPSLEMWKYWANLVTKTADDTILNPQNYITDPVKQLVSKMFTNGSDKRLWGAPGKYTIGLVPGGGGAPFSIDNNNVPDTVCTNNDEIQLNNIPAPGTYGILNSFFDFMEQSPAAPLPAPVPPSVTPALTGNPASLSAADIMAWIQAEYLAATGLPLPSPFDINDNGIDIFPTNKITLRSHISIDGCPNSELPPAMIGNQVYVKLAFDLIGAVVNQPFGQALLDYFDAKGYYPNIITAEFMEPYKY